MMTLDVFISQEEGGLVAASLVPHERVSSHCGLRSQWFGLARLPG